MKILIIAIVNVFYNDNKTKGCIMIVILTVYFLALIRYKPFRLEKFVKIERMLIYVLIITIFLAVFID